MSDVTSRSAQPPRIGRSRAWWHDYLDHPEHGPLPSLLLVLTVATGLIDAVSILGLGRVFVANMTGNVVFIGFALASAPGFSLAASLVALAGFLAGAGAGGVAVRRFGGHRGRLLRDVVAIEFALLVIAAGLTAASGSPVDASTRNAAVALAAIALGLQNAAVRRLAVPDLTTTVLTMTITGVAADLRQRNLRVALRRTASVAAMLIGAVVGAVIVLHIEVAAALFAASGLLAAVAAGAVAAARSDAPWVAGGAR
jgi:uncharacterized membrane protein YoaK (UPF0700 family)